MRPFFARLFLVVQVILLVLVGLFCIDTSDFLAIVFPLIVAGILGACQFLHGLYYAIKHHSKAHRFYLLIALVSLPLFFGLVQLLMSFRSPLGLKGDTPIVLGLLFPLGIAMWYIFKVNAPIWRTGTLSATEGSVKFPPSDPDLIDDQPFEDESRSSI